MRCELCAMRNAQRTMQKAKRKTQYAIRKRGDMIKRTILLILMILILFPFTSRAEIKLKIAVVNPSGTEEQTAPVRFDLPKGVGPEQVVDSGSMDFKYDFDKGIYYVYQTVKLKPSERKVLEVRLHDVWTIPAKDMEFLKSHADLMTEKLKGTKHFELGGILAAKIKDRLDEILKKQQDASLSAKEQIDMYYENAQILNEVKEDMGMLENLVIDVGGIVPDRVEVPSTMAVAIGKEDEKRFVKELTIKISNPSDKNKEITQIKYYLPKEVTPRYVLDCGGLDMGYDFTKERFYAYKENVVLEPLGFKEFVIKIKDIWRVADVEIDAVGSHAKNLMTLLAGTESASQGKVLADKIESGLNEISAANNKDVSTEEHIALYRRSAGLMGDAKKNLAQLEKLITQSGASVGVTVAMAEFQKGGGPQSRRMRGYEGIDYIAKSIFKGKAPDVATTWKIIWSILGFLAVISGIFFALQLIYHKFVTVDILTGLYLRGPFIVQLHKEHERAQASRGRYSLLMIDLDNFKMFNDTYGHGFGDAILRTVSLIIKQNAERSFTVGRFGGDEFIIVLPGLDASGARLAGEKILAAIKEAKIRYKNVPLSVKASVGSASYPEDAPTVDAMLGKVDEVMYFSKKSGGNRVSTTSR